MSSITKVFIQLILVKNNQKFNAIIQRMNEAIRNLCESNDFYFLYNDLTITDYLWLDEIHLKGVGTHIFSGAFSKFLNRLHQNDR